MDVDAALVHPNGKAYFFKGSEYKRFDFGADEVDKTGRIGSDGWRGVWADGVDAVLVHPNGKAYFFKGSEYKRFDFGADEVDKTGRIGIDGWRGVWADPPPVAADLAPFVGKVVQAHDGDCSRFAADPVAQMKSMRISRWSSRLEMPAARGLPRDFGPANRSGHIQGVDTLRDYIERHSSKRYRRIVVSYAADPGLAVFAEPYDGVADGIFAKSKNTRIRFGERESNVDIIDQVEFGNHAHPGGLQAHGDIIAVAMEDGPGQPAAVYFLQVVGFDITHLSTLTLGEGAAGTSAKIPHDAILTAKSAASCGFLKLASGRMLVAVSGANYGRSGIWFYQSTSRSLDASTEWLFVDHWTADRIGGLCDIWNGKIGLDCFIGGGAGTSLICDQDGQIFLVVTTGTNGGPRQGHDARDDEYFQLFRVTLDSASGRVALSGEAMGKNQIGIRVQTKISMRWGGGATVTNTGDISLLNTERNVDTAGHRGVIDGYAKTHGQPRFRI